jgi:hypothetical protein
MGMDIMGMKHNGNDIMGMFHNENGWNGNVTEWEWMEWECYRMGMDGMGMIHNVT